MTSTVREALVGIATQKPDVLRLKEKENEAQLRNGLCFSRLNGIRGSLVVKSTGELHIHLSGITKQIQFFCDSRKDLSERNWGKRRLLLLKGKSAGVRHVLMDDLDKGEDISAMEKERNGDNSGIQKLNGGRSEWVRRR